MLSRNLEKSLHRALAYANERRHEYATLEHLLLALTEDEDAVAMLQACGVDLDRLRQEVLNYIDNELTNPVAPHTGDAKPTAPFQRALQRAAIHVQSSGRGEVTGANVLIGMFGECESHAVNFLQEEGVTRSDAVNYIKTHGLQEEGAHAAFPGSACRRNNRERREIDETKIIAAILCSQTVMGEAAETDRIHNIVDLYERILAELRARGHGGLS
jgi:ATP-dependent Clp protease ATP-binding subunit ClpA